MKLLEQEQIINILEEALAALDAIQTLLGDSVIAAYLYGSAVSRGLRKDSDVDILAVTNRRLTDNNRTELASRLLTISGRAGNLQGIRPLEVTIVCINDITPWQHPPRREFIYGEWLYFEYERGQISAPGCDSDLAILLYQVRETNVPLLGREARELIAPIPISDVQTANREKTVNSCNVCGHCPH
ncbi:MAG: nucleotidyltransferase domain-containing protein [Synergistaceae bacterium]|nr:nucleotidyltransferase domain-containing protein [Synergistaceae bacterium]